MLSEAALLAAAALAAGALNALAGGGSFLTLPALMACGVPPVAANATGTLALLPGYLSASWATRADRSLPPGWQRRTPILLAVAGGASGALLLLITPDRRFAALAPMLLLLATLLFALQPRLQQRTGAALPAPWSAALLFAVCLYGGYFNGGLGILLLAALGAAGLSPLAQANALKNQVSAVLTTIAALLYLAGGAIVFAKALWMMVFAAIGGYAGARLGRRMPPARLRALIVLIGLAMAAQLARVALSS
ncbi:MAG TPA: sulfite exporter TauE/SafE family protein [Solimonas sp.]|nr:sulfite exporter TauE/SafE family protein [Solimonas sp.]